MKKHFYTAQTSLQKRFKKVSRQMGLEARTPSELKSWQKSARNKLRALTGYETMVAAPLKAKITDEKGFKTHLRQRVEIQSEAGVIMTLYVLIPRGKKGPFPVMIAPHGHVSGGKLAVVGEAKTPQLKNTIAEHNYDYGIKLVEMGFITFCPDARGFGERRETFQQSDTDLLSSSCIALSNMGLPLGQSVTGMWTFDLHRLIDYIETRKDCIAERLGCGGLSGGGLQTLWATALDERIKVAVISGYLYGYKESLLDLHMNCSCNYVPRLYEHFDMGDIAALIAPRPLLVETGTADPLNGASNLKNVESQTRIIKKAYRIHRQTKAFQHDVFKGPHRWNGIEAYPFLKRHLLDK